jgi:hypothetical protein
MASAVAVLDTHAPLSLGVQYFNAKGKAVNAPANANPVWTVTDTNSPTIESQNPSGFSNTVTLTGDGSFTVNYTDGAFNDTLPVTVSPDQTPASVQIVFQNP